MRALALSSVVFFLPSMALAEDWWVVVGFFDHPSLEWDDGIMTESEKLDTDLAACDQSTYWDYTAKFEGFDTDGRGTVFVVNTEDLLTQEQAETVLQKTLACVPDAYVKEARYFGE
jgi:hypothetical protein